MTGSLVPIQDRRPVRNAVHRDTNSFLGTTYVNRAAQYGERFRGMIHVQIAVCHMRTDHYATHSNVIGAGIHGNLVPIGIRADAPAANLGDGMMRHPPGIPVTGADICGKGGHPIPAHAPNVVPPNGTATRSNLNATDVATNGSCRVSPIPIMSRHVPHAVLGSGGNLRRWLGV